MKKQKNTINRVISPEVTVLVPLGVEKGEDCEESSEGKYSDFFIFN